MKTSFAAISATTAFLFLSLTAHAADLAGSWKGTWTKDGDALPVTVKIESTNKGYSGSFDSDALQVAGIPFSEVTEKNGKVHILLKGDETATVFDGDLAGDALGGAFTEGDTKGTFALTRAALPTAAIGMREVTYRNGDVTLAGTLLLPAPPGRHPAVLFLHGSGPEGRWANRWLAQKFAEAGIVALISDKRGVGRSTGDWNKVGFDDLADDAVAGIRALQSQPEVDPSRVGTYGHSQGGTISPLVAERAGDIAFVVASAPGGVSPADMETYSVENSIGVPSLPPAEAKAAKEFVHAIVDVGYRGTPRDELDRVSAKYKTRAWYFDPPPPENSYWTIARLIANFEPMMHWRNVRAPVLLIFGSHDERVPSVLSASAIRAALFQGAHREKRQMQATVKFYQDADHTFTIVDPPRKGGWPRHENDYAGMITSWILSQK